MLPSDAETRNQALVLIKQVLGARGDTSPEDEKRMSEIARLFGMERTADEGRISPMGGAGQRNWNQRDRVERQKTTLRTP